MLMKRKILLICALSSIAISFLCVLTQYAKLSVNEIVSVNVDALAQVEHSKYNRCWRRIRYDISDTVLYCGTCTEIPGTYTGAMDFCQ